jgi:hypothetical protein
LHLYPEQALLDEGGDAVEEGEGGAALRGAAVRGLRGERSTAETLFLVLSPFPP